MKRIFLLISIALISVLNGKAQDFHMSMYDAAPLYLNPSMTGVFEGDWRIHAQYRNQWKSVNFKPYTTGLISFDIPYKKWGFGAQIVNYRAGIGNYNAIQAVGSAAYSVSIDNNKYHNLSFGLQAGATQKSVEYQLHTFNNQYVTSNGGGFDNQLNSNETFAGQTTVAPVTNAGFMYYYTKQQSKINPFIGVSAFNLIEPTESFFQANNTLERRYYGHLGVRWNLTEALYLIPKVFIMKQGKFEEQTYAVDAGYYLKNSELYLLGGIIYRNLDAVVINAGVKMENYIFKVGYDFNASTLTPVSTGRGAIEISFTYMKRKENPKTVKICPRL
ncbi:MAG: type IX secretion system PorP/SprF family membrane protein [Flavobacteriales bacterium]|jgi:type IX secretion system PorP/SprF family membrane protein